MGQGNEWVSRSVIAIGIGMMLLTFSLFDFGQADWAVGAGALSVLLIVIGMRLFRRSQPASNFSRRTGRQPIPLLDGDVATKGLIIVGLLVLLVGIWLGRSEQVGPSGLVSIAGIILVLLAQRRFKRVLGDGASPTDTEETEG